MYLKISPFIAFAIGCIYSGINVLTAAVSLDENGWTVVTPSSDSRIIYVSSSEGDNANDGLSPEHPKRTVSAGAALIRDGYPDHLLLKRGDVFLPADGTNLGRWKSGRNVEEPVVVGTYGESGARPVLIVTNTFVNHDGDVKNFQTFLGLDIYKSNSDPDSPDFDGSGCTSTMRFVGGGAHLRVEDCRLRFGMMTIESLGSTPYTWPEVRRNIITDTWDHGSSLDHEGRIQGLYISGVRGGYTVEENFFDHNGWSEVVSGAGANMYNHNVYIQYSNVEGGIIRGNIVARGAAHGIQARSGGIMENNLYVLNAISFNMGGHRPPTLSSVVPYPDRATENVVLSGRRMDPNDGSYPRTTAIWGIAAAYIGDVLVEDNIVANRKDSGNVFAINGIEGEEPVEVISVNNIVYNWSSSEDMTDPSWQHPGHDMGNYYASIGGTDDTIAYLEWLRERPLKEMPWDMTAYSAINYIRKGFRSSSASYLEGWPRSQPIKSGGGSTLFQIESDLSWTVTSSENWISVDKASASGNDILEVSVDPNVSTTKREGVITVKSGSFERELNIWQNGLVHYVTPVSKSVAVNGAEAVTTLQINANTSWTISSQSSWAEVEPSSGNGSGLVTVTAEDNTGSLRIGQLSLTGSNNTGNTIIQLYQAKETWAGINLELPEKNVETGEDMMGMINVIHRPWVWLYEMETFVHLSDRWVTDAGGWIYIDTELGETEWEWAASSHEDYYYSRTMGMWAYCLEDPTEVESYWAWILFN